MIARHHANGGQTCRHAAGIQGCRPSKRGFVPSPEPCRRRYHAIRRLGLTICLALLVIIPAAADAQQIRVGILKHDIDFLTQRRESGTDINLEWQGSALTLPATLARYTTLRPFLGYSGHMAGDATDEIYGGGMFDLLPGSAWAFNIGLGLSVHDGKLHRGHPNRSALGQRVLFYASFELGRWWGHNGLFIYYQHASNGPLPGPNEGINNAGLRYGYRF